MAIYRYGEDSPQIHESAYVADSAVIIGKVVMAEGASAWSGAVVRGDNDLISIGHGSNLQEGAVVHTDPGLPVVIGDHVTVGHQAMLHGCTVGEGSLIGIQAVVLNRARIGRHCLVGAGAVVTEGKEFPDRSMILGAPAKVMRTLSDEEVAQLGRNNLNYVKRAADFKTRLERIG